MRLPFKRLLFKRLALPALAFLMHGASIANPSAAASPPTAPLAREPAVIAKGVLGALPGSAAVGVWQGGKAAYGMHSGAPSPQNAEAAETALFEIGSVSKVFTGLLLAQAVERGELRLDDTLDKLLAGKVSFSSPAVGKITLEQLVTHRSCLPRLSADLIAGLTTAAEQRNPYRNYSRAQLWQALAAQPLASPPPCAPSRESYSNFGFAVLGELLAQHYGKPWQVLVKERITQPLGMSQTVQALGNQSLVAAFNEAGAAQPWDFDAYAGAGALRSSAADMLTFGRALLAGASGPLGAAATRVLTPLGKDASSGSGSEVGYAIVVQGPPERRTYSHNGGTGGYRSLLLLQAAPDASAARVLVVLASNTQAEASIGQLQLAVNAERYPVSAKTLSLDAAKLAQYAGVYRLNKSLAFTFVVQNGQLYGRLTGQGFNPLQASAADTFSLVAVGAQFVFERASGEQGLASSVTLKQGGQVIKAQRSNEIAPAQALMPDAVLQAYAGRYQLAPGAELEVRVVGGQLLAKLTGQSGLPVFAVADKPDRFAYDAVDAQLQFERADGKVVALVLHQNGEQRAVRLP